MAGEGGEGVRESQAQQRRAEELLQHAPVLRKALMRSIVIELFAPRLKFPQIFEILFIFSCSALLFYVHSFSCSC